MAGKAKFVASGVDWIGFATQLNTFCSSRGEAMRRLALSFPQSPQSYLECPYFDLALFSFDEKFVSSLDG